VAVIGNGTASMGKAFVAARKLRIPLYVDPGLRAYQAAGMVRSVSSGLAPQAFLNAFRTLREGYVQGATQGDPWQQGGVLLVKPSGDIVWSYISSVAGDHPEMTAVLAAARAAAA
jgi:hypothetical protein